MEILIGQKRTMRVSKGADVLSLLFAVMVSPLDNPSPTALPDLHSLAPFWPLRQHKLVLLWRLLFLQSLLTDSLSLETWPGSLLTLHTLPGAPTHGFPTTDDYQIPPLSCDWFSGLQSQVCVFLLNISTSQVRRHLKHTTSKTHTVFPTNTHPLLHTLAQWSYPFPNGNPGVIRDFSLFLAPQTIE